MCGIVGYSGDRAAAPVLLEGLSALAYRGYDSAGMAVSDGTRVSVVRAVGRLSALKEKTDDGRTLRGTAGIGHTRWATHGAPTEENAHPQVSDPTHRTVGVHNGIIENHLALRHMLKEAGYIFTSETDTEAAVKQIDMYYGKTHDPLDALRHAAEDMRGSYALAVMFSDRPGEIYAIREQSPLVVGLGEGENFLSSDIPGFLAYTKRAVFPENGDIIRLTPDSVTFFADGRSVERKTVVIPWDKASAEKGGYDSFMLKEIYEEPDVIHRTVRALTADERISLPCAGLTDGVLADVKSICFVACGSAYHVGAVGQYVTEKLSRLPVRVEIASEFRYRSAPLPDGTLTVFISQSGETADTLAAMRWAKSHGFPTLAVVNAVGSTLSREADFVLFTPAGPEIAGATTKAYSAQLITVYALAMALARAHGHLPKTEEKRLVDALEGLSEKAEVCLRETENVRQTAAHIAKMRDVFFIGRGADYPTALEGSLKLKEVSYVHAEAYAAGELKHGTISLIENGTPVVGLMTEASLAEKTLSNLTEVKSRGAYVIAVTDKRLTDAARAVADEVICLPTTEDMFLPSLAVLPLQLLACFVGERRGLDIDKPRNLAKSVTVE